MASLRGLLVPLLAVSCQVIAGIETREEYEPAAAASGSGGSGGSSSGGSSAGASTSGGASGTSGTSGGAGEGGEGGEGPPAICGDAVQTDPEACDDGAENGQTGKCDVSCLFVCENECPLRVDPEIAEPGDGKTWATALGSIQDAVDQQLDAGGGEVWVKSATVDATGASTLLTLKSGVDVYGGFDGTELAVSQRTTPTGDSATTLDAGGESYPAVVGAADVTFDGFVVMNATGTEGPAFRAEDVQDLTLRNVFFLENQATGCGGAMWIEASTLRIEGGSFERNLAGWGGGAICMNGTIDLDIDGTRFIENSAVDAGGAYFADTETTPTVLMINTTFIGNEATNGGGGAIFQETGQITIRDSDFVENRTVYVDSLMEGAAIFLKGAEGLITNSVFARNRGEGSAIHSEGGDATVVGCTFAFNDTEALDGTCPTFCDATGYVDIQNSVIITESFAKLPGLETGVATGMDNCVFYASGGPDAASPFDEPLMDGDGNGVEEFLLAQDDTNPCLDSGTNATSGTAGIDWRSLTTSADSCLDAADVDLGRHYQPAVANAVACE